MGMFIHKLSTTFDPKIRHLQKKSVFTKSVIPETKGYIKFTDPNETFQQSLNVLKDLVVLIEIVILRYVRNLPFRTLVKFCHRSTQPTCICI